MKPKSLSAILAMICLLAMGGLGQQSKGKRHSLKGMVTNVSKDGVTVDHGQIEGYSKAGIRPYRVDKAEVLGTVKKGDHIEATVYDNDDKLYDLKVAPYYDDTARPVRIK